MRQDIRRVQENNNETLKVESNIPVQNYDAMILLAPHYC